jgi:hypothetical protein
MQMSQNSKLLQWIGGLGRETSAKKTSLPM